MVVFCFVFSVCFILSHTCTDQHSTSHSRETADLCNPILIGLDCYNKNTRGCLNNTHLFPIVLEAKSKCQQILCLVKSHFLANKWSSFNCLYRAEGMRELSGVSLTSIRALILFMRILLSWPNHLLVPSHWELWIFLGGHRLI